MGFTLLTGSDVERILATLTPSDVHALADALLAGLAAYSRGGEAQYQPERAVVRRPTASAAASTATTTTPKDQEAKKLQTSLFMPATTPDSIGVKIVGIRPDGDDEEEDNNKGSTTTTTKTTPPPPPPPPPPALQSVLTVCDARGRAVGTLNAAGLTAFRTALGSMLLYRRRARAARVVVFGAGRQALWHARLAALLRVPGEVERVTFVNRSRARAEQLAAELGPELAGMGVELDILPPAYPSSDDEDEDDDDEKKKQQQLQEQLKQALCDADAIFCTVPSTRPLFPASLLDGPEGRAKTRYLAAIGSYRLDMRELDPDYLRALQADDDDDDDPYYRAASWRGGAVAVDTAQGCLAEAGELVAAGRRVGDLVEVGELLSVLRGDGEVGGGDKDKDKDKEEEEKEARRWVREGLVVYKSVGCGVMDLAVAAKLLEIAREKGIGYHTDSF